MEIKNFIKPFFIVIFLVAIIIFGIVFFYNRYTFEDENKQYSMRYFVEYDSDGNVGVIDREGKEIVHSVYLEVFIPNPEKDVFICKINDDSYEIINSKGEKLFEEYSNVNVLKTSDGEFSFEKEVLLYEENGKYGLINLDGDIIAKAEYDKIESLNGKPGKLLVQEDNLYGVIDSNGKLVIPVNYYSIEGDNYCTEQDGYTLTGYILGKKTDDGIMYGYISSKGKVILKAEYESIARIPNYNDKENIYLIQMKNGKKGVYKNKKKIIENLYQKINYSPTADIIAAETTKSSVFYNLDGKQILPKKYQEYSIVGKYISVLEDDSKKLYDNNGNFIINSQYKNIEATSNPNYFITVDENNHYSIMNKSTEIKDNYINLKYAYGDYFIFTTEENKVGVLNVWSGIVVNPEYDSILKIYNINALEAKKGNETTIFSSDMKKISTVSDAIVENIKEKYAVIYSDEAKLYIDENGNEISNTKIFDNTLYSIQKDGKWGFQDKNGNIKVDCIYDMVTEINEYGFAGIKKDGKWGVIDKEGNVILEPNFEIDTYYFPSFIGKTYIEITDTIHCIKLN